MSNDESILEELCTELGRFLLAANGLEQELFELYVAVSGLPRADALTQSRGETMGRLLDRFLAAFRSRVPNHDLLASLAALEGALRAAVDKRNEFVHASWSHPGDETLPVRYRRPRRATTPAGLEETAHLHPNQVFGETHRLWEITDQFIVLRDDTLSALGLPGWWDSISST